MTRRDWRGDGNAADQDADADVGRWPGKRNAFASKQREPSEWPGKRSISQGLPPGDRFPHQSKMEQAFGADFSDVRAKVGAKSELDAIGAHGVARGNEVKFASSSPSEHLVAHELTHVVQQRRGNPQSQAKSIAPAAYSALESEADAVADRVTAGQPAGAIHGVAPGIEQRDDHDDVLPPPTAMTWGGDPFLVTITHPKNGPMGDTLTIEVRYTGAFPTSGFSKDNVLRWDKARTDVDMSTRPFKASAKQVGDVLDVDLFGDDVTHMRIADVVEVRVAPDKPGRRHTIDTPIHGYTASRWILVEDPKATPVAPGKDDKPPKDIPGEMPVSSLDLKTMTHTLRIDGDGDQHKELLVEIKAGPEQYAPHEPKTAIVEVTQLVSNIKQRASIALVQGKGDLFVLVSQITDGGRPTTLTLQGHETPLQIHTPTRTKDKVSYVLEGPSGSQTVVFPIEPEGQGPQAVVSSGDVVKIGGLQAVDITLGAYRDPFRITIDPASKSFGVAIKGRGAEGKVMGGQGVTVVRPVTKLAVLPGDGLSIAFDLDGDGKADVTIYDTLVANGRMPEENRNHTLRLAGPALAAEKELIFKVISNVGWGPYATNSEADHAAASNAQAVGGLQDQASLGTAQQNLDAFEGAMYAERKKAYDDKLIPDAVYKNWEKLNAGLIVLRAAKAGNTITPTMVSQIAAIADAFYAGLAAETKGTEKVVSATGAPGYASSTKENPYTKERTDESWSLFVGSKSSVSTPSSVGPFLRAQKYNEAFAAYNTLQGGLDQWIITKLKSKGTSDGNAAAKRLEYLGTMRTELGNIADKNPTRLQAVFHPNAKYEEARKITEVPLSLYYWHDDKKWHLKDLTNPQNIFDDDEPYKGESEPPDSLFKDLDYKVHFPKGIIHYQIPGGRGGQFETTERRTLSEWLSYIGLGIAAVGFTIATFGTGAVEAFGIYVLAASSVVAAASSAVHIGEEAAHGHHNETLLLDIVSIVANLAGAGSLASGQLIKDAAAASKLGKAWTEGWAQLAKWADAGYKPLTVGKIVGDVATVAVTTSQIAGQLDAIEKSGASATEKSRLKALLLSQAAATAGLVAISIKGDLAGLKPGQSLYFYAEKEGGALVAAHTEKPATIQFSQATIGASTSDKMSMDELIKSMKTKGWQGPPIDVVSVDGKLVSLDNRRLYAARGAGIEAPVRVHMPDEKLPPVAPGEEARVKLDVDIWQNPDKTLTTTKPEHVDTPKYKAGRPADSYGEAALFRTANQEKLTGVKFPLGGELDAPFVTTPPMKAADRKALEIPKVKDQNDIARVQTKNLVAAIQDGTLDSKIFTTKAGDGSTFSEWYTKWVSAEKPVNLDGAGKVEKINYPSGMPKEFEPLIQKMVNEGDLVKNLRIKNQAAALKADIGDIHLDPKDPKYADTRKKLVDKYGEPPVAAYEKATFGVAGTPGREAVFDQVHKVVDDKGLTTIRQWLPDQEIYITGGVAKPGQGLTSIDKIKMVIVVPDGTGIGKIASIEQKASSLTVATSKEFADATGKGHLRIEATVRKRTDALAAMMTGDDQFARIDLHVASAPELAAGFSAAKAAAGAHNTENISPAAVKALTDGLPGLHIDPANPKAGIEDWLTKQMNRKPGDLTVTPLGGGASGAQVFKVIDNANGGKSLGIFKIFRDQEEMLREIASLTKIRDAGLTIVHPVGIGNASNVTGGAKVTGGALMEQAGGTIVKDKLKTVGTHTVGSTERKAIVTSLQKDIDQVAAGMAEMHAKLAAGRDVDLAFKNSEIFWMRSKWKTAIDTGKIPPADRLKIEPGIAKLEQNFQKAKLDATVVHGDGHVGNWAVDGKQVNMIDSETVFRSVGADGKGTSPAATDVGRFNESIAIQGKLFGLEQSEIEALQKSFVDSYKAKMPPAAAADFDVSMKFYAVNYDLIHVRAAATDAQKAGTAIDRAALDRVIQNLQ